MRSTAARDTVAPDPEPTGRRMHHDCRPLLGLGDDAPLALAHADARRLSEDGTRITVHKAESYLSSTSSMMQTSSPMFLALCDLTGFPDLALALPAFGVASR